MRNCFLILILGMLSACSGLRTLPEGEKLYTGAQVEIESSEKLKDKGAIKTRVKAAFRPKPNAVILGNRPKVWIHNLTNDSAKGGFKRWLHNKIGEPPVLMKDVKPQSTSEIIDAVLFNMGIFNGTTTSRTTEGKRKGEVIYTVRVHNPFTISNVIFPADSCEACLAIAGTKETSLLKRGRNYDLNLLRVER